MSNLEVVPAETQVTVARVQDAAMGVTEILAQVKLIQEIMGKVMHEGEHFGTIPGCGPKKTLLQPGAQKLTMTFRLAPEYQIQETNHPGGHKEYRVICTLRSISSGSFVGQGVGCCSTLEGKYRWKNGARKCPECGKETIIKGKAEYGGGWLCFGKKGGCGAKWEDGAAEIESQSTERVEHDSPADFFNTVLKMAKKRAFVDATITATAASDIFTQDIGDDDGEPEPSERSKTPQDAPGKRQTQTSAQVPKAAPTPKSATAAPATAKKDEKGWDAFLAACKARLLTLVTTDDEWAWWRYACDRDWILPTGESLADARAEKMFEGFDKSNGTAAKESIKAIFEKHVAAVQAMAAACPPEMRDELLRGMTAMKRPAAHPDQDPAGTARTKPAGVCCPVCKGTAIKKHADLEGVSWCQKCGMAWQDSDPTEGYEEHPWMWAKLPFAPKDAAKKDYKGKTLGQISRLDSRYFFGVVSNYKAEPYQGRPPSQISVDFADACEQAKAHIQKGNSDEENDPL